ncbi:hypothetical protein [uncultured Sunxiuqinia sp.]|uniref:hypothetical protein n=1 Tax=Sunxiuqinia rutila TaxID=1397841 RepID=UPI00261D32E9|nr:hypothetical protein [uncultured Sunxiuqinia sp.]
MTIVLVALCVFILNIPFGYLRSKHKKFSLMWWLYIHIPVPFVILLRIYSDIGFAFYTYPILVGAFFAGQLTGRLCFAPRSKN